MRVKRRVFFAFLLTVFAVPTAPALATHGWPELKTKHDRGDAIITRYQVNPNSTDFGVAADVRTGLLYVTQRFGNNVAVFSRTRQQFVQVLSAPTPISGPHTIQLDVPTNSVWIAAGEGGEILRLTLDPKTLRPANFVEYTPPGPKRSSMVHELTVVDGKEVWYTDGSRVGVLDVGTSRIDVLPEQVAGNGIMLLEADANHPRQIWVVGGKQVTIIDYATRRVARSVVVPQELGLSDDLSLHDLAFEPRTHRVYVVMRGGNGVVWLNADDPAAGPQGFIPGSTPAAGMDHIVAGPNYMWWTESLANKIVRHDPRTGLTVAYTTAVPAGYFNPHGLTVVPAWGEVWFTELEALLTLKLKNAAP